MVKRKRVGLVFSYDEHWIAGTYYILNIIHSLNTLADAEKPIVVVVSESVVNFNFIKDETSYKYLEYFQFPRDLKYNLAERILNKIGKLVFDKKIINKKFKQPRIDFLYPYQVESIFNKKMKKVNWIPDFQEDYLPQFFSKEEILKRKNHQKDIVCKGDFVILSSEDTYKDFIRLYPNANIKCKVLNFAVTHPNFENQQINFLLKKFVLPNKYYFSPNQFWAHKNHIIILKAINLLKKRGVNIVVAFSGKESDYRNLENFNSLKKYISDNNLENNIKFLGFLQREEQLCLMKNSIAIIQPSLFEGWSTVVEDSKALNKFIILSDLGVHKEQIKENTHFFNPHDFEYLAKILEKYYMKYPDMIKVDYENDINKFAINFMDLVKSATVK